MDPYAHRVTRNPFSTTPDLQKLYLSQAHRSALASMMDGIQARKGLIIVTGEEGIGKTTLLRVCLQKLAQTTPQTTCIFEVGKPTLSFLQLMERIAAALGVSVQSNNLSDIFQQLHATMLAQSQEAHHIVFVIDDAHKLSSETLYQIAKFTMPAACNASPIQIVLFGQPELRQNFDKKKIPHLNQQAAIQINLVPFTPKESETFIHHQLASCMQHDKPILTRPALRYIVRCARGVPKNLAILCADALNLMPYGQTRPLSVRTVKRELPDIERPLPFPWLRRLCLVGFAGLLLIGLSLGVWLHATPPTIQSETRQATANAAAFDLMRPSASAPVAPDPRPQAQPTARDAVPPPPTEPLLQAPPRPTPQQAALDATHRLAPKDTGQEQSVRSGSAQAGERPIAQEPAPMPSAAPRQRIAQLLNDAERLWHADKLTIPQGDSAYDRYQAVLQMEPTNVAAQEGIAAIIERYKQWAARAIRDEQYAKAIGYFQRLLTIVGPDAAIYHALGSVYHKSQQYPQARQAYEKSLQLAPNQMSVQQDMATLQMEQLTTILRANDFYQVQADVDADRRLTLSGYVANHTEAEHAVAIAQAQPGIEKVINHLKIRAKETIQPLPPGSFTSSKLIE